MTRKEKSKIICKETNKAFDLDQTSLFSCVWDALKEIEEKEKRDPEVRSIKTLTDRKEFVFDFLSLIGGTFTYIAKDNGDFYIYDQSGQNFTLKIIDENKIFIDNYSIFLNDSDCLKTLKDTLPQKSLRLVIVKHFEEKWGLNEKGIEEDFER